MANLQLAFHPGARSDALEAYAWYAQRSGKAAEAFQSQLEAAGNAIRQAPDSWAPYLFGTRRYLMKQFPFVVVYRIATDRIEILAVAHGRRKPGYWQDRLGSK